MHIRTRLQVKRRNSLKAATLAALNPGEALFRVVQQTLEVDTQNR